LENLMHTKAPRIAPIPVSQFTPEQLRLAKPGGGREELNLTRTMVQHPALYGALIPFAEQLVFGSQLGLREQEILILKTVSACRGEYEIPMHDVVARNVGLTGSEIESAKGDGADLPPFERALVQAADELVRGHCISDATWALLAARYSTQQLMEVVFLVGNYTVLAMATNSFGVEPEEDVAQKWKPF
jgi:alkylhydroperoxidase family enzyme